MVLPFLSSNWPSGCLIPFLQTTGNSCLQPMLPKIQFSVQVFGGRMGQDPFCSCTVDRSLLHLLNTILQTCPQSLKPKHEHKPMPNATLPNSSVLMSLCQSKDAFVVCIAPHPLAANLSMALIIRAAAAAAAAAVVVAGPVAVPMLVVVAPVVVLRYRNCKTPKNTRPRKTPAGKWGTEEI